MPPTELPFNTSAPICVCTEHQFVERLVLPQFGLHQACKPEQPAPRHIHTNMLIVQINLRVQIKYSINIATWESVHCLCTEAARFMVSVATCHHTALGHIAAKGAHLCKLSSTLWALVKVECHHCSAWIASSRRRPLP